MVSGMETILHMHIPVRKSIQMISDFVRLMVEIIGQAQVKTLQKILTLKLQMIVYLRLLKRANTVLLLMVLETIPEV